ncbi:MAG TPA: homoserine dehydrogenase [Candidatus Polarisedimenticolia bacterium]|nr:homoserine dehydrogenase [Candidatus Polarisedimenticolia bacterium]
MRRWRVGFLGFGNVNAALLGLLDARRDELRTRHGIEFIVTFAATRRLGAVADAGGLDTERLLGRDWSGASDLARALAGAPIDLLFEGTTLEPRTGEPATSSVRAALGRGVSVVTANKGPVAFAARELLRLARARGVGFRFESSVADCLPVFDLVETALPVGRVLSFHGVVNGTSNLVLQEIARGGDLDAAVRAAQAQGIAEADPSHDLDGWDQAVKAVILANVLLGRDLRPGDVERTPLSAVDRAWLGAETGAGRVVRLVASGAMTGPVRVAAESFEPGEFLATLGGEALGLLLRTEPAGEFRVALADRGVIQTAYGMLSDFVALQQGRLLPPGPLLD